MMEYKGYLSRVEFDDEAHIFHGEVINIRDVITFQGKSVDARSQNKLAACSTGSTNFKKGQMQ